MKRLYAVGFVLLLLVGLFVGGSAQVKTLYWNLNTEPPTLDPALARDTTSLLVIHQLFVRLTDYNSETGEIVGDLAKSWDVSEDGLKWNFKMREGVIWTDGEPINAYDVVYSMKRMLAPETAAPSANLLWVIKGAENYNTGNGTVDEVGIRALDENTVQFELRNPVGFFPALATRVCVMVPEQVVEKYGSKWTEAENIVTSGPYMLGEWQHDDHLILVKSPTYYDVANVKIDQIYNYMIVEATTAMSMYEAGKLDVLRTIPLEDMDRVKTDPVLNADFHQADRFCTYYYGFNNEKPPFDNLLVRKAFASAIDRESLVKYILKGGQKPAQTFITPRVPGYIDGVAEGIGYPYDPEAAKAYLAEAGYPNGEGFPDVTLMFNTSEMHSTIAQFAQQSLMETLNVTVNLSNQEWKVYLETCRLDCPQIFRMGWCASYPNGYDYLKRNFYSTIAENNANYKNEEFDHYVDVIESETDPDTIMEAFLGAETLLCDTDCAIVPLYYYTMSELSKPYVLRSFAPTINDIPYFKYWDISSH